MMLVTSSTCFWVAERVEGEKLALEMGVEELHGEVGLVGREGVDGELGIELVLA